MMILGLKGLQEQQGLQGQQGLQAHKMCFQILNRGSDMTEQ